MIRAYLKYWIKSKQISKIDNAFVQNLNQTVFSKINVVKDKTILAYRKELKNNKNIINVIDLGAGSRKDKGSLRTVKSIFKNASISTKNGKLISLLIEVFNCKTVLELGTSLGVGTSYLALNPKTNVLTIEGCPNISAFTQSKLTNYKNIKYYIGEFSSQFPKIINESIDLIYIDGNHTYEATIAYFNYFKKNSTEKAILIFDDIYWSKGMQKAWSEIIQSKDVSVSIDLFRIGIVFLDTEIEKNHFTAKF